MKAGDNLLKLGKRFKTTGRSIAYWNRAKYPSLDPDSPKYDPNRIEVGWKLAITPGVKIEDGEASPSAASPSPEASISIGPVESPPSDGTGLLVTHGSRTSNVVGLTFEVSGPAAAAVPIIDWLVAHRIPATFFVSGQLATSDAATRSVLGQVAAHPDLFAIGDGSWSGTDLTGETTATVVDQVGRAEAAIRSVTGTSPKPLFRPPDGADNAAVRAAAASAGFPYTILWDIDPDDAIPESSGGPTVDDIATSVAGRAQPGSIVRLHLGGENTLAALPGILEALDGAQLRPVTLRTMLGL